MIGENFKRLNRSNTEINKIKEEIEKAKTEFTNYSKNADMDDWTWNKFHSLEDKVKILEYQLWCAEYEDNRKRNWK